jgi:hypothetical protein
MQNLKNKFFELISNISLYADDKFDWVQDEDIETLNEADRRRYDHNVRILQETMTILANSCSPTGITSEAVQRLKELVNEQLTHPDFSV